MLGDRVGQRVRHGAVVRAGSGRRLLEDLDLGAVQQRRAAAASPPRRDSSGFGRRSSVIVHESGTTLKFAPLSIVPADEQDRIDLVAQALKPVDELTIRSNAFTPVCASPTCAAFPRVVTRIESAPRLAFHTTPLVGSVVSIPMPSRSFQQARPALPAGLLVGHEVQDDAPGRVPERDHRVDHRRQAALHVRAAAAVQPVAFDVRLELRAVLGRDDVVVAVEVQRRGRPRRRWPRRIEIGEAARPEVRAVASSASSSATHSA